jgi:UDP-N-acetylmuramate dehydrogenase
MDIRRHSSLKNLHTFHTEVAAELYYRIDDESELPVAFREVQKARKRYIILGGGSNILFTADFPGAVVHLCNRGIEVLEENHRHAVVKVKAGEVWDVFVAWCVDHGYGGVENLSGIPGSVGSSPIQNIGAYGAEMKDHFKALELMDISTGERSWLGPDDCSFGYRDSVFKRELKNRVAILNVVFRLDVRPSVNLAYEALKGAFRGRQTDSVTIGEVRDTVLHIRASRLPDPFKLGNAGSFFKNPFINQEKLQQLQAEHPGIPFFEAGKGLVKLSAGWLIEQCGWKGYRKGDAGVFEHQALVLVNHGNASGADIWGLAESIISDVEGKFGISLEPEVNIC